MYKRQDEGRAAPFNEASDIVELRKDVAYGFNHVAEFLFELIRSDYCRCISHFNDSRKARSRDTLRRPHFRLVLWPQPE